MESTTDFDLKKEIKNAVVRSQHCQRNWDLSREIPEEDMALIMHSATQCPSKQNIAYYKAHFITNREVIEAIHKNTNGFALDFGAGESHTNSQTLANLLIVFEDVDIFETANALKESHNDQSHAVRTLPVEELDPDYIRDMTRDKNMAVGIAAGYVNLSSSILGYSTGCCACFDVNPIKEILGMQHNPILLMGVGFKDPNKPRRVHHVDGFVFPSITKQEIEVNLVK
jgi:nitroreductase